MSAAEKSCELVGCREMLAFRQFGQAASFLMSIRTRIFGVRQSVTSVGRCGWILIFAVAPYGQSFWSGQSAVLCGLRGLRALTSTFQVRLATFETDKKWGKYCAVPWTRLKLHIRLVFLAHRRCQACHLARSQTGELPNG